MKSLCVWVPARSLGAAKQVLEEAGIISRAFLSNNGEPGFIIPIPSFDCLDTHAKQALINLGAIITLHEIETPARIRVLIQQMDGNTSAKGEHFTIYDTFDNVYQIIKQSLYESYKVTIKGRNIILRPYDITPYTCED